MSATGTTADAIGFEADIARPDIMVLFMSDYSDIAIPLRREPGVGECVRDVAEDLGYEVRVTTRGQRFQ